MTRCAGLALILCLLPIGASAQSSQGPMIVEQVENGFLAAPDFKITEFDRKTSGLAGGYAGVVFADAFFIGGGGYGLVTDTHGRSLGYGGLVMQWFGRTNETFGYSAKMLMGGGVAESTENVQVVDGRGRVSLQPIRTHQDFFVFEPEVNGLVRFSRHLRLTGGAGYRFTGNGWYHHYHYDNPGHLNPSGWTASIGLQIGSGS